MTHDELLDKIEDIEYYQEYFANKTFLKTVVAVIKLHRPEAQEHGQYEKCWNCNLLYPCPTIQAIEKELK